MRCRNDPTVAAARDGKRVYVSTFDGKNIYTFDAETSTVVSTLQFGSELREIVDEILRLDLHRTDLVVLSGCKSQKGKQTRGDDATALSRAFLYARAPSVMASLWNVDDEATKLLMVGFYTHLREGMSKAEALQAAQKEVRGRFPHPYYWASFELIGDPDFLRLRCAPLRMTPLWVGRDKRKQILRLRSG